MKKITTSLFSVFVFTLSFHAQQFGRFTDNRDGKTYATVRIGNQTWMAQNLAFRPQSGQYFQYNNDPSNVSVYGYLYDWNTACNVCPSGWKLPSNADWLELTNTVGSDFKPKLMKNNAWSPDEPTSNSSGFSGIPGGMRDQAGNFRYMGSGAYFWTSSFSHQAFAFARELGKNAGNWASHEFGTNQFIGMSVRCLQTTNSSNQSYNQEEQPDDEYTEREFQEPTTPSYSENHPIKKGVTVYTVARTQTCNEKQDLYWNYTGEYVCKPVVSQSIKLTIDIHLNDPMYDEALITISNLKTKEVEEYEIEHVEKGENGELYFNFSVVNQPHQFILNTTKKTLVWYSEWGHWQEKYYFN